MAAAAVAVMFGAINKATGLIGDMNSPADGKTQISTKEGGLFEFSKTIYMELLSIADDEDYGDFTDVAQGFDFVVNASKVRDRPGFALSLRPKPKQTPLSDDVEIIQKWLENKIMKLKK